jgi:hypothetical protein
MATHIPRGERGRAPANFKEILPQAHHGCLHRPRLPVLWAVSPRNADSVGFMLENSWVREFH